MSKWNRFFYHVQKDVALWLFYVLFLTLFRAFFVFYFRHSMEAASGWKELLWVALYGLRHDAKVATFWVAVPFLMSVAAGFVDVERAADRTRRIFGSIFAVTSTVACVITIGYFQEYHDQFNHFIFNLYYDDVRAIFTTIWTAYHPLINLAAAGIVSYGMLKAKSRFFERGLVSRDALAAHSPSIPVRIIISLVILALLVGGLRGSFGSQPLRHRDAGITRDEFLNKAILNPYLALLYAFDEHVKFSGKIGVEAYLPDKDVRKAAQAVFSRRESFDNLDLYLQKHAPGPRSAPPRHVILILMESYDAWPLLKKYESLGLTNNLKRLARNGLHIESFVPASASTMQSLSAIITSFPYTSVEINYQPESTKAYPSSLAETFRRLGYRTRLFYGGFLSWQRIGDFARAQGFDEVYGAPHISGWAHTNEWGVDDEYLFDFAASKLDDNRPSFTFILTTSYHPPYSMDVWAKGFPLKEVPADIAPLFDHTITLRMLGHLWYSDRCIGDFVRKMEKKLPRTLFSFTGDHYGRKFINAKPDSFERSAVPFILYGREVLKRITFPKGVAGSHIDIGATLIELTAPKGFTYYSVGRSLLDPKRRNVGIGWWRVIGPDYLLEMGASKINPLPGRALPENPPDVNGLKKLFNSYHGIGWWRVKRGAEL